MICKDCHVASECIDSRELKPGIRRRRYKCPECKERVSTLEMLDKDVRSLIALKTFLTTPKATEFFSNLISLNQNGKERISLHKLGKNID